MITEAQRISVPAQKTTPATFDVTQEKASSAWYKFPVSAVILIFGAIEGWFKRTDFSTDAISYLDISRAIPLREWKMIFNPLWSAGYPLLLAIARPLFPATPAGEWLSIHVVNFLIFIGAWCAFLFLLSTLEQTTLPGTDGSVRGRRFTFFAGAGIFASIQLCIDSVSRVGPDLMVSMFFFLAIALLLRLLASPGYKRAALFGLALGLGYWTKGIFLALASILLLAACAAFLVKKRRIMPLAFSTAIFAIMVAPYAAGLSWSYGQFTMGESGPLNYALHVNLLPRWTNWQGEPGGYGTPIHPTHQLMKDPDIFYFAEPYHNTYPPFGNIAYWYQGYRHFWSAKYQAIGIARDLDYFVKALLPQPIFYAVLVCAGLIFWKVRSKALWLKTMASYWPVYLPALGGILLYVQVHLEDRYLGSFLTILCLLPFVAIAGMLDRLPRIMAVVVPSILVSGAILNFAIVNRDVLAHVRDHYTYAQNPQWKLGLALERAGMHAGDEIAVVGGPNASCTWAYIAHLRIAAELGGEPFDQRHPVTKAAEDTIATFWHDPPQLQQKIVEVFRQTGAKAVIASEKPVEITAPTGWQLLPGTHTWIYFLR